jgi:hypothetical protein
LKAGLPSLALVLDGLPAVSLPFRKTCVESHYSSKPLAAATGAENLLEESRTALPSHVLGDCPRHATDSEHHQAPTDLFELPLRLHQYQHKKLCAPLYALCHIPFLSLAAIALNT